MDSIKHFFTQLFTELNNEDSWLIIGMLFTTFLIGLITNYFLNRSRITKLEEDLEGSISEQKVLKAQMEGLREQHALKEADLKKVTLELADKSRNLEVAETEKRTLSSRLNTTLIDLDQSKEEFQEVSNRIEDLNDQILGLRTKNAQLSSELEQKLSIRRLDNDQIKEEVSKEFEQKIADLNAENTLLKNSIGELKANRNPEGTANATLRISQLEKENDELRTQIADSDKSTDGEMQEKLDDLKSELAQLEAGNDSLYQTIAGLITENEKLKESVSELPQYEAGNEALRNSLQSLIEENNVLEDNKTALVQYQAGNEVLNRTIKELVEKNLGLQEELDEIKNNQLEWTVGEVLPEEANAETLDAATAKLRIRAAIGNRIVKTEATQRDDLKQIEGIGPFIEEKLNDLGIYTYEQISQLDDDLVEVLTTAIEFFPGRIDRDDWVGQADRLFFSKGNAPSEMINGTSKITTQRYATVTEKIELPSITSSTSTDTASLSESDDLKKIEGIGPKISQILNEAGIATFVSLSNTTTEQLNEILAKAGNRYKMHNPETWPKQAKLAAEGEWDKLKQLQDYLHGGRDVANG